MSEQYEHYRRKVRGRAFQAGATLLGGFWVFGTGFAGEGTMTAAAVTVGASFATCLLGRVWGQGRWYEGPLFAASPVAIFLVLALTDVVLNRQYSGFLGGLTFAASIFAVATVGSLAGGSWVRRRTAGRGPAA